MMSDTPDRFKNEILFSKKLSEGLKVINLKSPKFYIKMHQENNPGRLAINSLNCHTSEISRFVEHHLQPLVKEIPSYIKDTNDFVSKINNFKVPENLFLVTIDVKALCANISNKEVIKLLSNENTANHTKKTVATKVITTFLALILTLINSFLTQSFTFKSKAAPWEQYLPLHAQTYSCPSSKRDTSIFLLKSNPAAICASSARFLWYGPDQRTNLNFS